MGRKTVVVSAIAALMMSLAVTPASSDEAAAAAFESDTVVTANLSGGCFGRHEGAGDRIDVVVTGTVVTVGATSLSVTCHLYQTAERHHDHFGLVSAGSAATGGGLAQGYLLAKYYICTEIHASFATAPPYNKNCPAH